MLIDNSSQGNAFYKTTVYNEGTIKGTASTGIKIVSNFDDVVTNHNGTIFGGNGIAVLFGSGRTPSTSKGPRRPSPVSSMAATASTRCRTRTGTASRLLPASRQVWPPEPTPFPILRTSSAASRTTR